MNVRNGAIVGGLLLGSVGCGANSATRASPANVVAQAAPSNEVSQVHANERAAPSADVTEISLQLAVPATTVRGGLVGEPSLPTNNPLEEQSGLRDGLWEPERRARETPPEVARELAHVQAAYLELPALVSLPDFLSVNDVLALLPTGDRDYTREELHAQLQNRDGGRILGAYLDSDEQFFMLWVPDPAGLAQVLAIYDAKGVMVERKAVSRGKPLLRDILALESAATAARGHTVMEVFIERVTTMSVCCLPHSLEVYALTTGGKLRKLLDHPRSHTDVGPGVTWEFLNHFEFNGTRVSVSSVLDPQQPVVTFEYSASLGRYVPLGDRAPRSKPAPFPSPFEH